MQIAEQRLVARCQEGDLEAFAQVYAQYEQTVFRYAYHLLGHREDADDIKQETFLRAYQAIGKFRNDASLQTWLLRICANLCRDRIKSWERRKVSYQTGSLPEGRLEAASEHDPARIVERAATKEVILTALHALPAGHREVVVLHDVEGLDYREIAQVLGCSQASAKLRVFRARRCLKERVTSLLRIGESV